MFLHLMKALLKGEGVVNGYQVWLESFYNSIKGKAMRLYIIGNGFDIRHGLPTRYKHFKSYVAKNDKELYDAIEEYIPAGDEWNELESALGEIDYELILQNSEMFLVTYNTEDWSDAYHHDYQYEVDKITRMLSARLKEQFADWVKGINIADAYNSEQYIPPIPRESLYFSFNYTNTLQQIYAVPDAQIMHIHGNCSYDEDLILGHSFRVEKSLNPYIGPDQDIRIAEAYDSIDKYFGNTFKPSEDIIKEENVFFSSLKNVDEVIVLGHSLAEVDGEYFSEINKSIQKSARWIVALYKGEEKSGSLEDYDVRASNISYVLYEDI
ncbi:bacteriophage abortive infection AbiH family protein [Klebsiella pneumoniae]|uniref:bacteriophage abortive infection AbiH family protein n=1 Tax=Klebsiella pneumoniae TaxID=573 RepID=UPI002406267A|nr:bacteriophage abortive infection AbiH family protein [Klebsiella pneumoniae]MDG0390986.1 bacteriophage abortive infection AbiH family protein [Klebsiella pneumoniae]MDG0396427.1 bacteriophage abortive infection AbiH family protein [Klebsiella pneumoniae]MDG0401928.1 bacteriophage abortive infection AbiH family protein [Klebsiella pneumoniae]MDG0423479.1 bacteriophage abortive infection AbiH family protein [Klebsiella pneumoniae]